MATIEKRYLAPLNPAATITEADELKLHRLIGERLADTLTGNQSYFPEGTKKDSRTLAADLKGLISSLSAMQMQTSDPSNVLGQAIEHLRRHAERFDKVLEEDEPTDKIELSPELAPSTRDRNDIYVDPFPGPFSPPNPLSPQHRPLQRGVGFDLPNGRAVAATPDSYPQLTSRTVSSTSREVPFLGQTASQQTLDLLTHQPMSKWLFPLPIFDTRR